ncbi:MAG: hypothetical protein KME16_08160 [Scytolyngbya sp. HA4215-MV1]|jgi:hypothetical protein|nr:hypothetical protein [Scytolyngbya sp. HA4215-MV1]
MKLNSNLVLTLTLLFLMAGAGAVSAAWGFSLGREALKGITQPDVRPINNVSERRGILPRREKVMILREDDILAAVKARMEAGSTSGNSQSSSAGTKSLQDNETKNRQSGLPIVSQSRGVTLEVTSVRPQDSSLVLDVNLRNDGGRTLRFLYSFLSVTDDRGQSLSANADGLPSELPPYSETFKGTISIPIALLDDAQTLSLSLTDYPDQQLQLQMSNIPVVR